MYMYEPVSRQKKRKKSSKGFNSAEILLMDFIDRLLDWVKTNLLQLDVKACNFKFSTKIFLNIVDIFPKQWSGLSHSRSAFIVLNGIITADTYPGK